MDMPDFADTLLAGIAAVQSRAAPRRMFDPLRARKPITLPMWESDLDTLTAIRAAADELSQRVLYMADRAPDGEYESALGLLADRLSETASAARDAAEMADAIERRED